MQSGAVSEQETQWAIRWRDAPHGFKDAVIAEAARVLHVSKQTLYRKFKQRVAIPKVRRRRADAGKTALTREEAMDIAELIRETLRMSGKKNMTAMKDAMAQLRANGLIRAQRIDPETGEVFLLSDSTIFRALRQYNCHPKQLAQPAPVTRLRSLHPNHLWQIDASRCVLYYLPTPEARARGESGLEIKTVRGKAGLQDMDMQAFNKNKPANLMKAMKSALWRYVITDHTSGWLYVQYVLGGESAANVIEAFIGAMTQRSQQAMHGVPKMVMLDPGGANTSAAFINVCHALGVKYHINAVGNPRAKGQVEKGQDIVERGFESRLKTVPKEDVATLEQINALASRWVRAFNADRVHSRHGMTRDAAWMRIRPEELVAMPDAQLLRQLAASKPEERLVDPDMTVQFMGKNWNVKDVPGVLVGQKLFICRNAFDERSVQAMGHAEDGMQTFYVLPEVLVDAYGQRVDAPVVGQSYQRHADTPVQTNLKEMERRAMGAATDEEAAQKRKAKAPFMGGNFDSFADIKQLEERLPIPLPRRGQEHELAAQVPVTAPVLLTHIQAAKRLSQRFKDDWDKAYYPVLEDLYPAGVPEDRLDEVFNRVCTAMNPAGMRAMSGAGAAPRLSLVA